MKYLVKDLTNNYYIDAFNTEAEAKAAIEDYKRIDTVEGGECEYEIIEVEE